MVHHSAFSLLLLTCLTGFPVCETEQDGTMVVPSSGPSNIHISGPPSLIAGATLVYTCSAQCQSSCSYSWTVIVEDETFDTAQGNTISVTPPAGNVISEKLICEAVDTVSHLFISKTVSLLVTSIADISIEGDTRVMIGQNHTFTCSAECVPSCNFTWKYMGKTVQGKQFQTPVLLQKSKSTIASHLQITFSDYFEIEPLTCEVINSASRAILTATKNLTVIDPISVHPMSQDQPVAGKNFSLQCAGSQGTVITWLKNRQPMPISERVQFSPNNSTMTFNHLLETDDGLYQCVVAEGATPMQSAGYNMQVNYGPFSVEISGTDVVTVGIPYGFQCSANCYPECQFTWTRGSVTYKGSDLPLEIRELEPAQTLTCTATNPATGVSITVNKTIPVTEGPSNVQISGPEFLTTGSASVYTCYADCYPSCRYSWTIIVGEDRYPTVRGDTISVSPPRGSIVSEKLVCYAEDTVSNLFISTTVSVWVASTADINIEGDTRVMIGQNQTFTCSAECVPSCSFIWTYMGKTVEGNQFQIPSLHQDDRSTYASNLQITVDDYFEIEPLTCEAINTASRAILTTTKNLTVIDPISVHPVSHDQPVQGRNFSLQCVGSHSTVVTWLKNREPMVESERVHCSNTTMTFNDLLVTDDGLYQCVVGEGATSIQSAGYYMQMDFGPFKPVISGTTAVTVGIPYGFQCSANCYPLCHYTWTRGNVTSEGEWLNLQLKELEPEQTLTCTATNPATGVSESVQIVVQVTEGPSNINISGPAFLTVGSESVFKCSAHCSPPCNIYWNVVVQGQTYPTVYGETISVTPAGPTVNTENLICYAEDPVSHLYISTTLMLWVPSVADISITGDTTVTMGQKYSFICFALCVPSCTFKWKYMGKTYNGKVINLPILVKNKEKFATHLQITVSDYSKNELLTCEATNTLSKTTITTTKEITAIDPISVHPTALPVVGETFSLQCVGSHNPTSITWLKNKEPMPESDRVHFSDDNAMMTFSPLLQTDDGLYQCVVAGGAIPIKSTGYEVQATYGPDKVLIVKPNNGSVGEEMFVQPGSITKLQCLADCFPSCSISWYYHDKFLATNTSILFTPVTPPYQAALTCVAVNLVSMKNGTAETTVVVADGPTNVTISGPDSLESGVTASFTCSAVCNPPCSFTWTLYGKKITGSVIDITLNGQTSTEFISCQAENAFTGKTAVINETLSVSEPHWCGC